MVLRRIRQGKETPAEQVSIQLESKPLILLLQQSEGRDREEDQQG